VNEQEKKSGVTQEETVEKQSPIPMYMVILHNDDVTPMDFVVTVLLRFFISDQEKAQEVMMTAHNVGQAIVAVMPLERAEFKVSRAHDYVRAQDQPLTFTIEPCE
jgi:ATP-dependent Clp protease adaptor protein ClpS